jgi:ribosomal protein S18 acetylase RimI-like enzyme
VPNPRTLNDVQIRTTLRPGDLGYITFLHGDLYHREYQYGIEFEMYVSAGLNEFYEHYDPATNRVWICEHGDKMVGFMLLMNRGDQAQLRYFIILPEYRGLGLGTKLMDLFMEFMNACRYKSAYLWTTNELSAAAHLYRKYGFQITEEKKSTGFGKVLIENRYDLVMP